MFECPNCGGNLKFDIAKQQMLCSYCSAEFDPYGVTEGKEAEQGDAFGVTVFVCPQCAGEIYSTDNTAAGFCIFCGASNVLYTRFQNEKRPDYIIPFQKTKEDCKREYMKMMRHALFAPKELKSERHIESFRGIYMPYWVYDVTQQGPVSLAGSTSHRSGDYIITDHYDLNMDLDNYYKGLSYDASSSFADNISEKVAPFDVKYMKEFTPAFLSGFYADTADVDASVYEADARNIADRRTKQYLKKSTGVKKYTLDTKDDELGECLNTEIRKTNTAMFPVWFMSYRNRDRVAYATVNGQTGKVVADLPVDVKKYMIGSVLLAVPIAIAFNFFLTIRPVVLMPVVSFFSVAILFIHSVEMGQIVKRESYKDDRGMAHLQRLKKRKYREERERAVREAAAALGEEIPEAIVMTKEDLGRNKETKKMDLVSFIVAMVIVFSLLGCGVPVLSVLLEGKSSAIATTFALLAAVIAVRLHPSCSEDIVRSSRVNVWTNVIAVGIAEIMAIVNPVSDLYYYSCVLFIIVAVFFLLLDLIKKYNLLATRRLPQFEYKGGDDRA